MPKNLGYLEMHKNKTQWVIAKAYTLTLYRRSADRFI